MVSNGSGKEFIMSLGVPELLIILVIVLILFGASRLRGLGGALGGSIKEFKDAVGDDPNQKKTPAETAEKTETKV